MKRYELWLLLWVFVLLAAAMLWMPLGAQREGRVYFRTERLRLDIGEQEELKYVLATEAGAMIEFSSDAPLVASVSQQGVVTGISPGTAVITLSENSGLSAQARVEVQGVPVRHISLDAETLSLQRGQRTRLTAYMNDGVTDPRVFWRSEDENVVVVDENGQIEAVGNGTTRVVATAVNGMSAACEIVVGAQREAEP